MRVKRVHEQLINNDLEAAIDSFFEGSLLLLLLPSTIIKNFKGKKPNMKIYINSVGGGIRTFKT